MTDLASQKALTRPAPHLPLSWYFDPKVAEAERKFIFDRGPGYVAHEQMAPNPGDYRVLDWRNNGAWALINNDGRHDLVSNVCRHRQSIMLKGSGSLPGGTITCPLHRSSFDLVTGAVVMGPSDGVLETEELPFDFRHAWIEIPRQRQVWSRARERFLTREIRHYLHPQISEDPNNKRAIESASF